MAAQIKFGTSGWRAVMAEEFTFANVCRAVNGIARYVVSQKPTKARVIIGRDPRFLGDRLCGNRGQSGRGYQLYGFAQPPRIQRNQILHPRRGPGAARSHPKNRSRNRSL